MSKNTFEIDFIEFCFLVEACIPPKPISRTFFFNSVCDTHFHQMSKQQRKQLFEWITDNPNFDLEDESCIHFFDRFNPDNQFLITTNFKGKEKKYEAYKHKDDYHTSKNKMILKDYILKEEKITY